MARKNTIQFLRTTRAALNAQAGFSGLIVGEPYTITDENGRLAIAYSNSSYQDFALSGEAGSQDVGFYATGTGTGSPLAIPLPQAGLPKEAVTVTVNGLVEPTTGYTISGSDLTITAVLGDRIVVRKNSGVSYNVGANITVSSTEPSSPSEGDLWVDIS